ncbi:MAG: hypothetical protein AAF770_01460 [Bacteroidota bacterium]
MEKIGNFNNWGYARKELKTTGYKNALPRTIFLVALNYFHGIQLPQQ